MPWAMCATRGRSGRSAALPNRSTVRVLGGGVTRMLDRLRVRWSLGRSGGILWQRANGEWNGVAFPVLQFNVEVERPAMLRIECR
jgi:hypothetical protein